MAGSLHQEGNRINLARSQKDVLIGEMMNKGILQVIYLIT